MVTPSASGPGGSIVVTTSGQGSITTQGVESHGIWATSTTGTVQVNTTSVSTTGEFSAGINAAGGGGTTVNVAPGAVGEWAAGSLTLPASARPTVCRPPALSWARPGAPRP